MAADTGDKLVIAISSRALFNLDDSHQVYTEEGLEAYSRYQIEHEEQPLEPGEAFPMVRKLLDINARLDGDSRVEVILMSRNSADTGLRIFNSIQHYDLNIERAAFCGGESPYRYIRAFGTHLFLSTEPEDVRRALEHGIAAATLVSSRGGSSDSEQLRLLSTVMRCCSPTKPSECSKARDWPRFRTVSRRQRKCHSVAGLSNPSWLRCSICNMSFQRQSLRFARRW